MARPITPGKPALYHHTGVRYFPFGAKPGAELVLTSEPWAFLRAFLQEKISKSRADNKIRFRRALYYASLAEEFCRSAESTNLPARATLAYYGVLNLVKCFICVKGLKLGDSIEHHGLSPSESGGIDIRVSKRAKKHVNIFHEFVVALGAPQPTQDDHTFADCISHIPEVHEVASRLELLPTNERVLLPIDVKVLVDDKEEWLFTDIYYWKKHDARMKTSLFYKNARKRYFRESRLDDEGRVLFRCERRKRFSWTNFERIYANVCKEYEDFDIAALLTRDGYRYYCDLSSPKYHHLAYSFMAMFHLGTVTRYNPGETEQLLDGRYRPVISEILSLTPKQLMYQLISRMTESVCVVPFAKF